MDIKIGRTITVNTGNFQSVKPSVEIDLKNVDVDKCEDMAVTLSSLVENLLKIEIVKSVGQIKDLEKEGHMEYCKNILESIDDIEKSIETSIGLINV